MSYASLINDWKKVGLSGPQIYLLECQGNSYAVIDDSSTIITVASKTRTVYAVAKSKVSISNQDDIVYYTLEDPRYLKVISCTENTNVKQIQKFVLDNIIQYL